MGQPDAACYASFWGGFATLPQNYTSHASQVTQALDEVMNLNAWNKRGEISIWRYEPKRKNFPGWHMTANSVGYDSLVELLTLLKNSMPESKRTIKLDPPDKWSASSELKKTPEEKAVFQLIKGEEVWKLKNVDGKLIITLNYLGVSQFLVGIQQAKNGEYDFSIGGTKGQNLWFW